MNSLEAVIRRMSEIGLKQPGVESAVAFPGLSISGFSVAPDAGIVFFTLKPFEERKGPSNSVRGIFARITPKFRQIGGGTVDLFTVETLDRNVLSGGIAAFIDDEKKSSTCCYTDICAKSVQVIDKLAAIEPCRRIWQRDGER